MSIFQVVEELACKSWHQPLQVLLFFPSFKQIHFVGQRFPKDSCESSQLILDHEASLSSRFLLEVLCQRFGPIVALYLCCFTTLQLQETKCRCILTVLLFKTKQSLLNSFAKPVVFYICGRFVAGFSLRVWKTSGKFLCCCPDPHTSFFAGKNLLQALQKTKGLLLRPVFRTFT